MPLINCPECNKEISSRAKACPFCGCPAEYFIVDEGADTDSNLANRQGDVVNNTDRMDEKIVFYLFQNKVAFSSSQVEYIDIRRGYQKLVSESENAFNKLYENNDLGYIIQEASDSMNRMIYELVRRSVKVLYDMGIIVSNDSFIQQYGKLFLTYDEQISEVVEKYAEIMDQKQQLEQYRSLQQSSRSQFVGGGFGIKGAIKGATQAAVLNAGLNFARSFGDNKVARQDQKLIDSKIAELKNSEFCKKRIIGGVSSCILGVFMAVIEEIEKESGKQPAYSASNWKKARNLLNATRDNETDPEKAMRNYFECIKEVPYTISIYSDFFKIAMEKKDQATIDEIYRLCHFLGFAKLFTSYDKEINDVESNYFAIEFYKQSEELGKLDFENYSAENLNIADRELDRLKKELGDNGLLYPRHSLYCRKLEVFKNECLSRIPKEKQIEYQKNDYDNKSLTMIDFAKDLCNKIFSQGLFTIPVSSIYMPGMRERNIKTFSDEELDDYFIYQPKLLFFYDSSTMHMGNKGFAVETDRFTVFESKKKYSLDDVSKFENDGDNSSLIVFLTNGEKIIIPYKFSMLDTAGEDKDIKARFASGIVGILELLLEHYRGLYDAPTIGVELSVEDAMIKANAILDSVLANEYASEELLDVRETLNNLKLLDEKNEITNENYPAANLEEIKRKYAKVIESCTKMLKENTNIYHVPFVSAEEQAIFQREVGNAYKNNEDLDWFHNFRFAHDIRRRNLFTDFLSKLTSETGKKLYDSLIKETQVLMDNCCSSEKERFATEFFEQMWVYFPEDMKKGGGLYRNDWYLSIDSPVAPEKLRKDEVELLRASQSTASGRIDLRITDERVIFGRYLDKSIELGSLTSVEAKKSLLANSLVFNTVNDSAPFKFPLDVENFAKCINNALKARVDRNYKSPYSSFQKYSMNEQGELNEKDFDISLDGKEWNFLERYRNSDQAYFTFINGDDFKTSRGLAFPSTMDEVMKIYGASTMENDFSKDDWIYTVSLKNNGTDIAVLTECKKVLSYRMPMTDDYACRAINFYFDSCNQLLLVGYMKNPYCKTISNVEHIDAAQKDCQQNSDTSIISNEKAEQEKIAGKQEVPKKAPKQNKSKVDEIDESQYMELSRQKPDWTESFVEAFSKCANNIGGSSVHLNLPMKPIFEINDQRIKHVTRNNGELAPFILYSDKNIIITDTRLYISNTEFVLHDNLVEALLYYNLHNTAQPKQMVVASLKDGRYLYHENNGYEESTFMALRLLDTALESMPNNYGRHTYKSTETKYLCQKCKSQDVRRKKVFLGGEQYLCPKCGQIIDWCVFDYNYNGPVDK